MLRGCQQLDAKLSDSWKVEKAEEGEGGERVWYGVQQKSVSLLSHIYFVIYQPVPILLYTTDLKAVLSGRLQVEGRPLKMAVLITSQPSPPINVGVG